MTTASCPATLKFMEERNRLTHKITAEKSPADRDHGDVFFMVAKHPGQNVNLEPQFTVGVSRTRNG